jgi:hypothetical protein
MDDHNAAVLRDIELRGIWPDFRDFLRWLSFEAIADEEHDGPDWTWEIEAAASCHRRWRERLELVTVEEPVMVKAWRDPEQVVMFG